MDSIYNKFVIFLSKAAIKLKQLSIYLELRWYVVHKKPYIRRSGRSMVNTGKSYSLALLSSRFSIPIVTYSHIAKNKFLIDSIRVNKGIIKKLPIALTPDELTGKYEILLFDEGISIDQFKKIIEHSDILIGFE